MSSEENLEESHSAPMNLPGHLHKRKRRGETCAIQKLPLAERADLILPVISEKAQLMCLTQSLESIVNLQRLIIEHPVIQELAKNVPFSTVTSDEKRQLRHVLEGLQVQDLITLLKSQDAPLSVQLSIETLAVELKQEWAKSKESKQGSKAKGRKAAFWKKQWPHTFQPSSIRCT